MPVDATNHHIQQCEGTDTQVHHSALDTGSVARERGDSVKKGWGIYIYDHAQEYRTQRGMCKCLEMIDILLKKCNS